MQFCYARMNIPAWLKTLPDEALRGLELREWHGNEVDAYVELLNKHHYLKCPHARKRHLSQVACYQGKAVALIIWTTSSRKWIHRDVSGPRKVGQVASPN